MSGLDSLRALAEEHDVSTAYLDGNGVRHEVAAGTLERVLVAMGVDPVSAPQGRRGASGGWPPVVVARRGASPWTPPGGGPVTIRLESGATLEAANGLPVDLPLGYHEVTGRDGTTALVVAPRTCHHPARLTAGGKAWGWAIQLYALASERSWGIGDLGALSRLTAAGALGADFTLLNPLHAAAPTEPSPYFPSSRMFANPLYLDVEAVPEAAYLGSDLAAMTAAGRSLRGTRLIDRPRVAAFKDAALRRCYAGLGGTRRTAFGAFRRARPAVEAYARFCALQREHPASWPDWPAEHRRPDAAGIAGFAAAHAGEVGYHAYLQWLLDEQLADVPASALGLVTDLAVGFSPEGFDAWLFQDVVAAGMTVGAPPDVLGPRGQNWGLPPFAPGLLREAGYLPFAETLRANLRHAGGLRIDHVFGLFRLFWVPDGAEPADGTYVGYPADDLLGILALESVRARAFVVGEDLGTFPPQAREMLAANDVLSYRVAWFEREESGESRAAAAYPRLAMAAVTTHDLPTVAGFFSDSDLAMQRRIGVITGDRLPDASAHHEREKGRLRALLEREGLLAADEDDIQAIAEALYRLLAGSPSMLVSAALEDALGVQRRPNVPGTTSEHPNWSVPLPVTVEGLLADGRARRLAELLSAGRRAQGIGAA